MGLIVEIHSFWGVACHSEAMIKKSSLIRVRTAKSSSFTFTVNSASAVRGDAAVTVPERLDHQT